MLYFSLFSGEIYDSTIELSDPHQLPLTQKPDTSCKRCHGRFYQYYNMTHKHYVICNKCAKKCLDPIRLIKTLSPNKNGK